MALYAIYSPSLLRYLSKKGALCSWYTTDSLDMARTFNTLGQAKKVAEQCIFNGIGNGIHGSSGSETDWTIREVRLTSRRVDNLPNLYQNALETYRRVMRQQAREGREKKASLDARAAALAKLDETEKKLLGIG